MKIKTIRWGRTINPEPGSYFRMDLEGELEPEDDPDRALLELKLRVDVGLGCEVDPKMVEEWKNGAKPSLDAKDCGACGGSGEVYALGGEAYPCADCQRS